MTEAVRDYNVGDSDYSKRKIQPWDIWLEYKLNPWDADILKRVLRTKESDSRVLDYQKIKHICDERIRQLTRDEESESHMPSECSLCENDVRCDYKSLTCLIFKEGNK